MKIRWKAAEFPMAQLLESPEFLDGRAVIWRELRAGGAAAPLGFAWREDRLWICSEWVDGEVAAGARGPSIRKIRAAVEELAVWERRGVAHGDLSPRNLVFTPGGARWIDWDWCWKSGPAPWRMNRPDELSPKSEAEDVWRLVSGWLPELNDGVGPTSLTEAAERLKAYEYAGTARHRARNFQK